jgi:probable rRNA maturation factor
MQLHFAAGTKAADWPLTRPRVRRLIAASLPPDCGSAELTIAAVSNAQGRSMNRAFRRKDYATNILTFGYEAAPDVRADLVLCPSVIRREARAQGKSYEHHLMHLLVHGVLHACGLDHMRASQARQMEALEIAILRRFRIADPYAS